MKKLLAALLAFAVAGSAFAWGPGPRHYRGDGPRYHHRYHGAPGYYRSGPGYYRGGSGYYRGGPRYHRGPGYYRGGYGPRYHRGYYGPRRYW